MAKFKILIVTPSMLAKHIKETAKEVREEWVKCKKVFYRPRNQKNVGGNK